MNEREVLAFVDQLCDTFSHGAPQTADARKGRASLFGPALVDVPVHQGIEILRALSEAKDTHFFPQLARLNEALAIVSQRPQARGHEQQPCRVCHAHARGVVVLYVPTPHGIQPEHISCQCPLGDDEHALVAAVGTWFNGRSRHLDLIAELPWRRKRRTAWASDWPDRSTFDFHFPEPGSLKWAASATYNAQLRLAQGLRIAYGELDFIDLAPPIAKWSALGFSQEGPGPLADRLLRCWSWQQLQTLLTPVEEGRASRAVDLLGGFARRHEWTVASVSAAVGAA